VIGRHRSARRLAPAAVALAEDFSDGEGEVLGYLRSVLSAGEIAAEMHVSVNTVKAQLRSIHRKPVLSRRRDAVRRAYERGLVP
jgi:LuxR family transcriptional regulator, maltose regulon positive regulatory protein